MAIDRVTVLCLMSLNLYSIDLVSYHFSCMCCSVLFVAKVCLEKGIAAEDMSAVLCGRTHVVFKVDKVTFSLSTTPVVIPASQQRKRESKRYI